MLAKANNLDAYEALPPGTQAALMALTVLMDRVRRMPKDDRDDLFELVQEWQKAQTPDEARSIHEAMNEIIAQAPVESQPLAPAAGSGGIAGKRKTWAEHVGRKVRHLREQAGLTQTELAKKADIPQPHLCRVESADLSPTHKTLKKIADALGVEVGEIDPCVE